MSYSRPRGLGLLDCGGGLTAQDGGTCPPAPAGTLSTAALEAQGAAAPECPAGFGVPTFSEGVSSALADLPYSVLFGTLSLFNITQPNAGNVVGPDHVTLCHQANRETPAHVLGLAAPGLAAVALILYLAFGRNR